MDYVAVVLVIAAVFAAAVGVLVATGLGEQVTAAFRKALCVVTGGPCDEAEKAALAPCVLASDERSEGGSFTVSIVRVGDRNVVLRERRSDGTIALTLVGSESVGADLSSGFGAHARWGEHGVAVGRELRAAVLAERSDAKTWIVEDDARADTVVDRIRLASSSIGRRGGWRAPEPAFSYTERGSSVTLDLRSGERASLELSADFAYGERIEHATGRRTVYVRDAKEGGASVAFGDGWSAAGEGAAQERFGVTFDRAGRPVDFVVLSTLDVEGGVGLPPRLARIAGWLRIPTAGAKHVETEQHLDLTDPFNAAAARAFLGGLAGGRTGLRMAARALRERIESRGTLSVRSYAGERTGRVLAVRAKGLVAGGGLEVGSEEESARLLAAIARQPDGTWGADPACAVA